MKKLALAALMLAAPIMAQDSATLPAGESLADAIEETQELQEFIDAAEAAIADFFSEESQIELFTLYNHCKPMSLMFFNEEAGEYYMTFYADRVRTIVESRLRAARLYDSAATDAIFQVEYREKSSERSELVLRYAKPRLDLASGVTLIDSKPMGIIWHTGGLSDQILQLLSEAMDEFINDYLRVNETWCD